LSGVSIPSRVSECVTGWHGSTKHNPHARLRTAEMYITAPAHVESSREGGGSDRLTIVAPNEGVPELASEVPALPLLRLFHCNVHKSVQTGENPCTRRAQRPPSRQCQSAPRYVVPVFSLTTTGLPTTAPRNSDGFRFSGPEALPVAMLVGLEPGCPRRLIHLPWVSGCTIQLCALQLSPHTTKRFGGVSSR
jgi:hypothetical protein